MLLNMICESGLIISCNFYSGGGIGHPKPVTATNLQNKSKQWITFSVYKISSARSCEASYQQIQTKIEFSTLFANGLKSTQLYSGVSYIFLPSATPISIADAMGWNFPFRPHLDMSILHRVVMFRPWNAGPQRLGMSFLDSIVPTFVELLQDEVSFSISEALEPVQHLEQVRNRSVICGNFFTLRFGFRHRNGNLQNS